MSSSVIEVQRDTILNAIGSINRGDWKTVILDANCTQLVYASVTEDDILKQNVTNVESIEEPRPHNQQMDAVYILSPLAYSLDYLLADIERSQYRKSFVYWTSALSNAQEERIQRFAGAGKSIAMMRTLGIDFHARESHLITFRDPWSFPILYHPACNSLVRPHLESLAQKIVGVCVALGEYPAIRYLSPHNYTHEASVLCSHLAHFVQTKLDLHAKHNKDYPPQISRPRGILLITDRALDLRAPFVHEFTYQAMIHDLLPLSEGEKIAYRMTTPGPDDHANESKNIEISERDALWTNNRHSHMKDLLERLSSEFQAFKAKNPQFAGTENASSLNNIKDMLAGLPQYQEGKEAFSLHLSMASDAMALFQSRKLGEIASIEQSMATGFDEDQKKPRNVADQIVRLLDTDEVISSDRLRLLMQYILYRNGLLLSDIQRLLAHAQLPSQDTDAVQSLTLLGANVTRDLKDPPTTSSNPSSVKSPSKVFEEDNSDLSRFAPSVKSILEELVHGQLDQTTFPFLRPTIDATDGDTSHSTVSQTSLRSAKPTWAKTRPSASEPLQRVMLFVAGGATYSEARACYEVSRAMNKDIFLITSHMLTPNLFVRQVKDLSVDRRKLHLPVDQPKQRAPDLVHERRHATQPNAEKALPTIVLPPTMRETPVRNDPRYQHDVTPAGPHNQNTSHGRLATGKPPDESGTGTDKSKAKEKEKEKEKKRKHIFFGSKR